MTFEEFFTRKRIDLAALQKAEPALFSEFRSHFEQMGEKSFDHTKKYWFNKLRHSYHLAPEVKPEKVHVANPLAEQTVTESLSETVEAPKAAPKPGFVPRFKAASMTKPSAETKEAEEKPAAENIPTPTAEQLQATPKLGFTPKFQAANPPKAVEAQKEEGEKSVEERPGAEDASVLTDEQPKAAPKLGFTPKFRAANPPKIAEIKSSGEEAPAAEKPSESNETTAPKPAYKPRFNMKNMPPKKEE